ncbi:hypothetical protein [Paenibacillus donghaensis]|uniref:hypothetical protein n=1 Tax=Paenibacillus donghaensis TaxID=414771 RepID=UPI001D16A8BC|nr:hypothetical protein [Paenibacillus donghaensis]
MWMRGLKIIDQGQNKFVSVSHPMRMRGLKDSIPPTTAMNSLVASYTDAWIESKLFTYDFNLTLVASYVDAWIESCLPMM